QWPFRQSQFNDQTVFDQLFFNINQNTLALDKQDKITKPEQTGLFGLFLRQRTIHFNDFPNGSFINSSRCGKAALFTLFTGSYQQKTCFLFQIPVMEEGSALNACSCIQTFQKFTCY